MNKELKPCPFCGEKPDFWSCDRLIKISCNKCNYHMSFDGIISRKKSDVPIHYEGGEISTTEFYHQYAEEEAVEVWNTRFEEHDEEIRTDERRKFAEWIDAKFGVFDTYGNRYGFEELIEQYKKECVE